MFEVFRRARMLPALVLTAALLGQLAVPAFASTVSTISGSVTDSTNGAPLAGVAVTARSASGTYHATTNARGFYSMAGLPTDDYTVSFELNNYQPVSIAGVSAFADEIATVNATLVRSLKTIANVQSRSVGGAFQPNNTADTITVTAAQIQNIQGSAFNLSESSLLRALPGVTISNSGAPSIRGGRTNMVDYEYEGIPYSDPYLNKYINNLQFPGFGLQTVQLSPGNEDASFGNSGDGTVNVIAKQGSYKGGLDAGWMVGGGAGFAHGLNLGFGFGSPNNRFTDYMSFTAQNTAPEYGGTFANYPANQIGVLGAISTSSDREFTNNFVYKFGRSNKYSLQYFVDTSFHTAVGEYGVDLTQTCFPTYAPPVGQPSTCSGAPWQYLVGADNNGLGGTFGGGNGYAGTGITTQEWEELLELQPGETEAQRNETLAQAGGRPPYDEVYNGSGEKLELDDHLSSSTYAFVNYFNALGVTISDNEYTPQNGFGAQGIWRNEGGWTNGGNIGLVTQLSDKNQLKFGATYTNLNPHNQGFFDTDEFWNITVYGDNAVELYDFIPPGQYCPLTPTNPNSGACGYLYNYIKQPVIQVPAGGAAAILTSNGLATYLTDAWQPTDKFHLDAGVRLDTQNYALPPQGVLPDCTTRYMPTYVQAPNPTTGYLNGKPVGPGNCPQMTFAPISTDESNPHVVEPRIAAAWAVDNNDALRASFGRSVRFINGEQMDYTATPDFASQFNGIPAYYNPWVAAAYAGATYNPSSPITTYGFNNTGNTTAAGYNLPCNPGVTYCYNTAPVECGYTSRNTNPSNNPAAAPNAAVPCTSYEEQLYWSEINDDFAFPVTPLKPVTASNYDLSYEHQFKHGWSLRVSPWSRRTYDLNVLLPIYSTSPSGHPVVNPATGLLYSPITTLESNNGFEQAKGLEVLITKEQPYGLSGWFSADSTSVRQNVPPTNSSVFNGAISPDVAAFPTMTYRVPYVAPFTAALALAYATHNGWRFQTTLNYTGGYPYGFGLMQASDVDGFPAIVPKTNANSQGNTAQFVDPSDPGSFYHPNVAATLGTPEGAFPDGVLTHPNLDASITVEKKIGAGKLGVQVFNLFNDPYPGAIVGQDGFGFSEHGPFFQGNPSPTSLSGGLAGFGANGSYQPVATGLSGPLTGYNATCASSPGACNFVGTGPYAHYPTNQGLNFFVYYTVHL